MKFTSLLVLMASLPANAALSRSDLKVCDLLYSQGTSFTLKSVECVMALLPQAENEDEQKMVYERAFIALSLAVNDAPKTALEKTSIEQGLSLLATMSQSLPASADYAYWSAVFTSFNAVMLDRGSVIPRKMFASLKSIQENLNRAISIDPSIHGFGPKRVLGIMNTQMPGIAGGDKTLAEKMLRDAYVNAPRFSINHVEYARILYVNGNEKAREVIEALLQTSDDAFQPYPNEPERAPLLELARDRKNAQELLDRINEE